MDKELQEVDYDENINVQHKNQRAIFYLQKYNEVKYEGFTLSPNKIIEKKI